VDEHIGEDPAELVPEGHHPLALLGQKLRGGRRQVRGPGWPFFECSPSRRMPPDDVRPGPRQRQHFGSDSPRAFERDSGGQRGAGLEVPNDGLAVSAPVSAPSLRALSWREMTAAPAAPIAYPLGRLGTARCRGAGRRLG
jgi:hypothetical protein